MVKRSEFLCASVVNSVPEKRKTVVDVVLGVRFSVISVMSAYSLSSILVHFSNIVSVLLRPSLACWLQFCNRIKTDQTRRHIHGRSNTTRMPLTRSPPQFSTGETGADGRRDRAASARRRLRWCDAATCAAATPPTSAW